MTLRLLLVEDNPGDVVLTREALSRGTLSTQLDIVRDGEEAIAYLTRAAPFENAPSPDLVLLDVNLPKASGHDVLAFIRSDAGLRTLPVIVLTSSRAQQDIDTACANQASFYCTKPHSFGDYVHLVDVIEQFARNVQPRTASARRSTAPEAAGYEHSR